MTYYVGNMPVGEDELTHYGIKGMRWGQRRFQNRDGSLTAAGRLKYGYGQARRYATNAYGQARKGARKAYRTARVRADRAYGNARNTVRTTGRNAKSWYNRNRRTLGTVAKVAGGVAAGAGLAYLGGRYGRTALNLAKNSKAAAALRKTSGKLRYTKPGLYVAGKLNKAKTGIASAKVNTRHFIKDTGETLKRTGRKVKTNVRYSKPGLYVAGKANKVKTGVASMKVNARHAKQSVKNTGAAIKQKSVEAGQKIKNSKPVNSLKKTSRKLRYTKTGMAVAGKTNKLKTKIASGKVEARHALRKAKATVRYSKPVRKAYAMSNKVRTKMASAKVNARHAAKAVGKTVKTKQFRRTAVGGALGGAAVYGYNRRKRRKNSR